jgi:hypothetical protein
LSAQKGAKFYYSGKKKRHTIKSQVVVNKADRAEICVAFSNGKRRHDFRLFKESQTYVNEKIKIGADTGFQGIHRFHKNSEIPKKRSKKHPLTKQEKTTNRKISNERALNEHAIGFIKRFRILSERYRNRRKRFGLRFNLVSAICNFELLN